MQPTTKSNLGKVWIDLDNSPHVPFFVPIIEKLEDLGYSVIITTRDCFQVCGLAEYYHLKHVRVGKHYGANKILKIFGTLWRSLLMAPLIIKKRPNISVTHGSRSSVILSSILNIPSILIFDYEHAKALPVLKPTLGMAPDMISDAALGNNFKVGLRGYHGLKEDVYVASYKPNQEVLNELNVNKDDLIATIRPPANEAHYHNPESDKLFVEVVNHIAKYQNARIIILPRNEKMQTEMIHKTWPELCEKRKIIIPDKVINGLDMIWYSDFVVSGGGTMNREAAALGVPVYSIFRGKLGAVDRYLSEKGRLTLLEEAKDVKIKLKVEKRDKAESPNLGKLVALEQIVNVIGEMIHKKGSAH